MSRPHITAHALRRATRRWRLPAPDAAERAILRVVTTGAVFLRRDQTTDYRLKVGRGLSWVVRVRDGAVVTVLTKEATPVRGELRRRRRKERSHE